MAAVRQTGFISEVEAFHQTCAKKKWFLRHGPIDLQFYDSHKL